MSMIPLPVDGRAVRQDEAMHVLVVGAGVIGLTCAVRLAEAGHRVDVLARDLPLETTSAVAAALWYPYRADPPELVTGWARTSFAQFADIAATDADSGVRMVAGTEVMRERTPDAWWADAVPSLRRLANPPSGYRDGWEFAAPVVEMPVYLRWLQKRLAAAGGTLTRMALSALPDRAPVVVNAAGLAAGALAGDPSVVPVRGQVAVLEQVGLDHWWLDGSAPTYVVPRSHDIVVGGTDEEGSWDRAVDPRAAADILARAIALVPDLAGARVLRHRVGLRPARPTVRIEEQRLDRRRVLHCYGHGGAGITLSWGCADDVVALL
jgi:D-amino-acid oxidase